MKVDKLEVRIFDTRAEMGVAAAADIQRKLCELLKEKAYVNVIFAAAPSQNEVLLSLVQSKEIDWSRIHAYHMDEYIGLSADAPQGFGNFLKAHIFGLAPFQSVNYIDISAKDPEAECARYAEILAKYPTDIVVMGIADFNDPKAVKPVLLDEICRNQQVNDGCFATIDDVPKYAITLTVPTLFAGDYLFCIVPAQTKANAVKATLCGEIGEILRYGAETVVIACACNGDTEQILILVNSLHNCRKHQEVPQHIKMSVMLILVHQKIRKLSVI